MQILLALMSTRTLGYKFKKEIHNTESTDHYKEDITNNFGIIIQNDYSDFNRIIYTIGDSFTKGWYNV